jgi:hypothetical protein
MRLSRNELIAKLRLGEDNLLGCKEVRFCGASVRGPSPSDLADELAAFANSRTGGTLLLGIDDKTRDVLGIPVDRLDLVEALVRQAVEDSINPPLAPVIERLTLPDSLGWITPPSGLTSHPVYLYIRAPLAICTGSVPQSAPFHLTTWRSCFSSAARAD